MGGYATHWRSPAPTESEWRRPGWTGRRQCVARGDTMTDDAREEKSLARPTDDRIARERQAFKEEWPQEGDHD